MFFYLFLSPFYHSAFTCFSTCFYLLSIILLLRVFLLVSISFLSFCFYVFFYLFLSPFYHSAFTCLFYLFLFPFYHSAFTCLFYLFLFPFYHSAFTCLFYLFLSPFYHSAFTCLFYLFLSPFYHSEYNAYYQNGAVSLNGLKMVAMEELKLQHQSSSLISSSGITYSMWCK